MSLNNFILHFKDIWPDFLNYGFEQTPTVGNDLTASETVLNGHGQPFHR